MNDFDSDLDARIKLALSAAANQITPETLHTADAPRPATARAVARTRWLTPVLAAAAVAAVAIGTVVAVTVNTNASGPVRPGGTNPSHTPSYDPNSTTAPSQTPHNTTATASAVRTYTVKPVCAFVDVPGCHAASNYVPLWPFADFTAAQAWAKGGNGSQPWHLDPGETALNFTRGYLGYTDITQLTSTKVTATEAHIGVGYLDPNGKAHTAAVLHLVRYGFTDYGWEVVGSDDTDFTIEKPAYGVQVTQTMPVGGRITGVDENIVVKVRMQDGTVVSTGNPSTPAGGSQSAWSVSVATQVPMNGRASYPLTVIAFTGGHLQEHERFAIQGVYA